jgi:ribose/xylose/arabinose/galactoside ABC-type transport system permease subunit
MRIIRSRESGVLVAFLLLFISLAIAKNRTFLSFDNLSNVGTQMTFIAITGIGVLFVILTSGVDLSLGSTVGLCSFLCAIAVVSTHNPYLGVVLGFVAAILAGMVVGAVNGAVVSFINVTPFIVTLGMMGIARSVIYVLGKTVVANHLVPQERRQASAMPVTDIPEPFVHALSGSVFGIPVPILVLIVVAVIAHFVLTFTVFGRRLYAIGGNEEATHLSGIPVHWVKFFSYVVCSAICGITGTLYVARFNQGALEAGRNHELDAIAAAVIGGTSLMGGSGSVIGVILGACVMSVVSNGLDLLKIPPEPKVGIIGAVIIIAAIVDVLRSRRGVR